MDICVQMLTPLDRFAPSVRWRFQSVIDSTVIESTSDLCAAGTDRLTCRITDITRGGHEGVYEAYRLRRQLRNWHPYIFLHVRGKRISSLNQPSVVKRPVIAPNVHLLLLLSAHCILY